MKRALWPRAVLSHALSQEGRDLDAAERALRDILALEPQNAEARQNLGVLLRNRELAGSTGTSFGCVIDLGAKAWRAS